MQFSLCLCFFENTTLSACFCKYPTFSKHSIVKTDVYCTGEPVPKDKLSLTFIKWDGRTLYILVIQRNYFVKELCGCRGLHIRYHSNVIYDAEKWLPSRTTFWILCMMYRFLETFLLYTDLAFHFFSRQSFFNLVYFIIFLKSYNILVALIIIKLPRPWNSFEVS